MKLYGIKNCDTVKKARKWLDENGVDYQFHDFKKDGLTADMLSGWQDQLGWEPLVNRRGTTWRRLPESVRDSMNARSAHETMLDNPSLIKRPVVEASDGVSVGFNAEEWAARFL
ncbi:arsenate reductase [Tamilnaduibacter salinus]|uniref:Arsenate reductase n=1 Tax=Tamilnaduibacter salinus TaxID=1484056 RepID=A0A2U1CTH0_9GAMM|nr:ArsC family reductase [Tamilnaduibacter salinus]PVY69780.1 arsenate reductase [Tamilnaduibacter salinus]